MTNLPGLLSEAMRHHVSGQLPEAERIYRQILQVDPRHSDALHLLGVIAHQVGQNHVAVERICKAIGINQTTSDYHSNLGNALRGLGRLDDAVAAYSNALLIKPDFVEAYTNLGNALRDLGRLNDAVAACNVALRIKPDSADAYFNLGNALKDLGRIDDSITAYESALCIRPDYAEVYSNLGNALHSLQRPDDAVAAYGAALRIKPGFVEAHSNLGNALKDLGRLDDAVAAHRAALLIKPDYVEAYSNLANALRDLGRPNDAVAACSMALRIKPDYAEAHFNESMSRLLLGDFAVGWPKYEWRWRGGVKQLKPRGFIQPQWQGEDIDGRTILLHPEQGLGDTIQFCRYASLVKARGGRVVLETPPSLLRIMSGVAGVDQLVVAGDRLPDFDYHCPLMSLPHIFGTTLETMPSSIPYLAPEPDLFAIWRKRLANADGHKIGIVWRGNPSHMRDRQRSVQPIFFARALAGLGLHVVSIQKDGRPEEFAAFSARSFFDAGPLLNDLSETAALIANLDLVISVDTSVCHLAGALHLPTWTILDFAADWRWLTSRLDSPWYPTMRLFRQSKIGEWQNVFDRIGLELEAITLGRLNP